MLFFALLCFSLSREGNAQNALINCNFIVEAVTDYYTCVLQGISIDDDETQNITVTGNHLPGRSNHDVIKVSLMNSNVSFIVTQFFTKFPSLEIFYMQQTSLNRIQPNAFRNARTLKDFDARSNRQLTRIPPLAFVGASNLEFLTFRFCIIDTLHTNSFVGLHKVSLLLLDLNQIRVLPHDVFRPLLRLETLFLGANPLGPHLDTRIFNHNRQLNFLSVQQNNIETIDEHILEMAERMLWINLIWNVCVDRTFLFMGVMTIPMMRAHLEPCFVNSTELKNIKL